MTKKLLLILALTLGVSSFAQFTTGLVTLTGTMKVKIDTNATTVTLTLTGPSTSWLGLGFGGNSMGTVSDMFIWNSTSNRDYIPCNHCEPSPDASQSWTIDSDNVASGTRTVVATRALVSSGDYTFTNTASTIPIIFAVSNTTVLSQHTGVHTSKSLTRSALGVEDFSLNASTVYPNPSDGNFTVKTKTSLDKINIYTQSGAFVKTVEVHNIAAETAEVKVDNLQAGVYLLELVNKNEKSWKKVIIK